MKKLLSILLVLGMLFSLVSVPAQATEDDVVFSANAKNCTLGGNANVWSSDPSKVLFSAKGHSLSFDVTVAEAGSYTLAITAASADGGHAQKTKVYVDGTLKDERTLPAEQVTSWPTYSKTDRHTFNLSEGTHTIMLENADGWVYVIGQVELRCVGDIVILPITVITKNYSEISDARLYDADNSVLFGTPGGYTTYDVAIEKSGYYKIEVRTASMDKGYNTIQRTRVYVDDSLAGTHELMEEGKVGWPNWTVYEMAACNLTEGTHTIKLEAASGTYSVKDFTLTELEDFATAGIYAGSAALEDGGSALRGTDQFKISFNYALDAETVTEESVYLQNNESGEFVPAKLQVSDTDLFIKLQETLDYETDYTLATNNLKDRYGRELSEPISLGFSTSSIDGDAGSGTIDVIEKSKEENLVTIKGTVFSGAEVAISGRAVKVNVTAPSGASNKMGEVISGEDGAFSFSVLLDPEGESGKFTFVVSDEYVSVDPFTFVYVTTGKNTEILEALAANDTAEEVKTDFETFETELGINLTADLAALADKDRLYGHLVNLDVESIDAVIAEYEKYLLFETLNQTDDANKVASILSDQEACEVLGLNKTRINLIEDYQTEFLAAVSAITVKDTMEAYMFEFDALFNEWLAREYDKTNVTSSAVSISAYAGQGADVALGFASAQDDVIGLSVDLSCATPEVLSNVNVKLTAKGTYSITNINTGIRVFVQVAEPLDQVTSLGSVLCIAPAVCGTYPITISGVVTYQLEEGVAIDIPLLNKTIELTCVENKNQIGNRGGSLGGASFSTWPAGSVAGNIKPDEDAEDSNGKEFAFIDLETVGWAEQSINALLEKEIISKSEDGKFNPNQNITREEFVKMMVMALGVFDAEAVTSLKDVKKDAWYYSYIASAEKAGLVSGDEQMNFNIGQQITREDMSVIIYRALGEPDFGLTDSDIAFADENEISDYAKDAVNCLKQLRIVNGVGKNMFAPKGTATRAMAAKVIYGMLEGFGI